MKLFISGGSGSLGRAITRKLQYEERVVVYSRTEGRQNEMMVEIPEGGVSGVRYFLGDIADYDRLVYAMKGCDIVIHAAAQKCIESCEYNIFESVKTNVKGTENIVRACLANNVKLAIFVSSDKATDAISAYGCEKFLGERIFINANNYGSTRFNVCRYGNVIGSAKSVFHTWEKQASSGEELTVASQGLTRFFWKIDEAADFIIDKITDKDIQQDRGCIYIPKMQSFSIMDVACSYSTKINITGFRCPEKVAELLVSETERPFTYKRKNYYVVYPILHHWCNKEQIYGEEIKEKIDFSSNKISKWEKSWICQNQ